MLLLHKFLPQLIMPPGVALYCLLLGFLLKKRSLFYASFLVLFVFSMPVTGFILMSCAEGGGERSSVATAGKADAIVVLSGMVTQTKGVPLEDLAKGSDRFEAGVELFKAGKAPLLVFTRGMNPWKNEFIPEGELLQKRALTLDVPGEAILLTDRARNTSEEAAAARKLFHGRPRILLVTSALHMRRAALIFDRAGFVVEPYRVSAHPFKFKIQHLWPNMFGLAISESALREIIGYLYYLLIQPCCRLVAGSPLLLLSSFLLGAGGALLISRYAVNFGLIDIPNERSSHKQPVPRGGGVGILVTFIASSLFLKLPLLIWLPASLLSLISFFDDKLGLSPRTRMLFQFAAAVCVMGYAIIASSGTVSSSASRMALYLVVIFAGCIFIVGTANFYNFMDGINGIAGLTGAVGFTLLGCFAVINARQPQIACSSFALATACAGFLPFNVPKARVFMGDVGSILLGFIFAGYVVLLTESPADFLVLAGCFVTFYADPLSTLFTRKRDGEQLSQAHRRHIYQLLVNQKQIPHWKISLAYGIIQLCIGVLLLVLSSYGLYAVLSVELCLAVLWCVLANSIRSNIESRLNF